VQTFIILIFNVFQAQKQYKNHHGVFPGPTGSSKGMAALPADGWIITGKGILHAKTDRPIYQAR
jgi:hypothetical protein